MKVPVVEKQTKVSVNYLVPDVAREYPVVEKKAVVADVDAYNR